MLFFCALLFISIVGLVSLVCIKRWEMRTGRMLFAGARPSVGAAAHVFLTWVEGVLPSLIAMRTRQTFHALRIWLQRSVARGLLAAEQWLEGVLDSIRGVTEHPQSNKEASAFLREVAEHKRTLLRNKEGETEEAEVVE